MTVIVPSERLVALFRALLERARGREPGRHAHPVRRSIVAALAALVSLVFVGTLRDTPGGAPFRLPTVTAPTAPAGDASCEVHVVDEEGRAYAGAVVRAFAVRDGGVVFFAGEKWHEAAPALFEGLPRGEVWIVAYGAGRSRASTRAVLGEARRTLTLALHPGHTLEVKIVDDAGVPVPGAEVAAASTDPLAHVARAGPDGRAVLDRMGPPPWNVTAAAEGFDPVSRSGIYPGAPLEIRLERLGGFDVTVLGVDGEPAPFSEVLVSGPGIWPARSTTTDASGTARIVGLYQGVYDLKARSGDHVSPTDMSVPLLRGHIVERTLRLEEGTFVSVRVTDGPPRESRPEPDPISGADVVLVEEGLSAFPIEGRTNKDGLAILGPVTEGVATVSARADGFVPRVVGGQDVVDGDVTIPLLRGGTIVGRVRDARGFPVDGATIEVIGTDLDGMPIHETTDRSGFRDDLFAYALSGPLPLVPRGELGVMPGPIPPIPRAGDAFPQASDGGEPWVSRLDGTFEIRPVTPGRVQLLVRHPEFIEALSDVVRVEPGGEVEVKIVLERGGRLEGRVVEEDRTAVAGARVEIAASLGTFEQISYTADDGTFASASVPDQVLVTVARAESPGEIAARMLVDVELGRTSRIEIVLPRPREPTTLRVVDQRDFPLSGVEVRVSSLDATTALARTFFSNDDGDVAVPGVRGLPLRIVCERPGKAATAFTIDPADREHRLTLPDALTMRGRVTARAGRDLLEGADVTLYTLAGAHHARTDERGEFEVADLGVGRVRIVARHEGHARAERILWFEGDARRPIEIEPIDLPVAGAIEGVVVDDRDEPVVGARVGLDAVPTFLPVGRLPSGLAVTDADGRFLLGGVPEGSVAIEAYSPELGRGGLEGLEVRAGRTTDRVVVRIPDQGYDPRKLAGAGSIALTLAERSGAVVVVDVPEGGEGEAAGIEPDDVLLSVSGRAVGTIEAARDALSGPLSEDVVLELERAMPARAAERLRLRVRRETVRR